MKSTFESVLIYTRIAKPFILPLQIVAFTRINITVCKTAARIAASAPDWRLPSSPIVEKKHGVSLCKINSVLIYTRIAKPFILPLQYVRPIKNSTPFQTTRTKLAATVANWRLLTSPTVEKNMCIFLVVVIAVVVVVVVAVDIVEDDDDDVDDDDVDDVDDVDDDADDDGDDDDDDLRPRPRATGRYRPRSEAQSWYP